MGFEALQSNMTSGILDPRLHARTDITKYANGVAEAENMTILPYGGLRRRPGLAKTEDGKLPGFARLEPFIFNINQKYLVSFRDYAVDIFENGILLKTLVTPYPEADIPDLDIAQSADVMFITHQSYDPRTIARDSTVSPVDFETNVIQYTAKPGDWTTSNYPRAVTIFGGRIYMAGTPNQPTTIWGSKVFGYGFVSGTLITTIDFTLGTADDDGISNALDTDQFNEIQNIFTGRDLQLFTGGAEFYNGSTPITPSKSTWKKQTAYGSKRLRPISIDGATLFVDNSGRTVREFIYDYTEASYVAINKSLLSSHLLNDIKSLAAIKGTEHDVGDYVYAVNGDGTVAVLNTMRVEEIAGWTKWTTDGEFIDVVVLVNEAYFLVKRKGAYFIEKLQEGTYTDHNVSAEGVKPETFEVVHNGSNVINGVLDVVHTDFSSGTLITELATDYSSDFLDTSFKVVADLSVQDNQSPTGTDGDNTITVSRGAYTIEVGLGYNTKVTTLPLAAETQIGNTLHKRKRVVKVDINVFESLGVYARKRFSGDRQFTIVLDQAPVPYTGFKEMYLLGYDRLAEIEISQEEPLPLTLRGLSYELEY